jgi:hypothetical protein
MDTPLTFFIIFHKLLFARNTEQFTLEEQRAWFRWYAANETIPKQIPDWLPKECLIEEYKLQKYDPEQQQNKSQQNSCFFHLLWNPTLLQSKYVGFGQYDISMEADPMRNAVRIMNQKDKICFIMFPYYFIHLFDPIPPTRWTSYFVSFYNSYYNTYHKLKDIQHMPLALLHTFILPSDFFQEMMTFVEAAHATIWNMIRNNKVIYAGTMERVFALCINFAVLEGKFDDLLILKGFSHNDSQHTGDEMRGIKTGSEA